MEKCNVMQMGSKNPKITIEMGGKAMVETEEEKDLGIIVSQNLKVSRQCG